MIAVLRKVPLTPAIKNDCCELRRLPRIDTGNVFANGDSKEILSEMSPSRVPPPQIRGRGRGSSDWALRGRNRETNDRGSTAKEALCKYLMKERERKVNSK